jgi:transcriptional antiterminator RfaH
MDNWYLVYTKPKNEDIVSQKFIDAGFEVLNPKLKERKVYRRKLQNIVSPLFPCYIFVKFDSSRDYHLVKYSRGVKSIVGPPGKPSTVPDEIIASLFVRMEEGVVIIKPQEFEHGEEIIIKAGPFEGFNAIFDKEMKGNERVTILIGAINARTVVDRAMIKKRV